MLRKSWLEEIKAFFSASPQILKTGMFASGAVFNGFAPSSRCLRKHRRVSAQCQRGAATTGIHFTKGGRGQRRAAPFKLEWKLVSWEIAGMPEIAWKKSDSGWKHKTHNLPLFCALLWLTVPANNTSLVYFTHAHMQPHTHMYSSLGEFEYRRWKYGVSGDAPNPLQKCHHASSRVGCKG